MFTFGGMDEKCSTLAWAPTVEHGTIISPSQRIGDELRISLWFKYFAINLTKHKPTTLNGFT
jgi:hypothetical protein